MVFPARLSTCRSSRAPEAETGEVEALVDAVPDTTAQARANDRADGRGAAGGHPAPDGGLEFRAGPQDFADCFGGDTSAFDQLRGALGAS
jgi:hypothetical protein